MPTTRRRVLGTCAAGAAALLGWPAAAQERAVRPAAAAPLSGNWPAKPVRVLVGFPAGASPDLAARAIARPLSQLLGQSVVVENKPGASGNTAAAEVAQARDDHTLGALINGNLTIARLLDPKLGFDPEKDFAPVGLIGTAPLVLAVSEQAAGNNPAELLLWARNRGADAKYGTPGNGTVGHLGMELLKMRTSIRAEHRPFSGNPKVIEAMLAGEVQMALLPPGLALPHIQSGKLKMVGITSPERGPLTGDWPTLREAEVRGSDLEIWTALAAPATMPPAAVQKLNAALSQVLRTGPVSQDLLKAGWQARAGDAETLARRMRSDTSRLGGVIMMRGIKT
ncbi:tripartite tricarboxylate transporter substrate-binding protein [Xenophilus arseniciresistens]|uniref:Tripartite tricarboxylate transporter substrate-binding protein n=1 Tax=Xenophilus arseniciresistens TaxID=1283306 RepID=A0AAE3N738_9BURK|nr:tripartite tricarboxylate transporter substrate-binding protein [Xenophilus arseniciresistens]MDA7417195.1 tripartite tricarboxylate transporter substrate-binding protein [Xenophilus arseniciresistens]